ncbi:MAG: ribosome biogenesis GTPase YlqF [Acholeplasmatales bacterium]|nr:MAG: ribosome biogenesis GTPase YlqF [Acholeplasmatales bacterium]
MKTIQWYPGHMAKTARQIRERLTQVDVIFELLDARAPQASRNPMMHDLTSGKPRLIFYTKADLADLTRLKPFMAEAEAEGHATLAINALKGLDVPKIVRMARTLAAPILEKEKRQGRLMRPVRAMILGIPNVGKSTLINQLVSRRVTKVGNVAGITKQLQVIRIHEHLDLLDTPGILWPKFEDQQVAVKLALLGSIKEHVVPLDDIVLMAIRWLLDYYPNRMGTYYGFTEAMDALEVLDQIGRARGCLKKGGLIDYDRVYDLYLHDLRHGRFGPIVLDGLDHDV